MRLCALVFALVSSATALAQPVPPPVANRDLRRTLERIDREAWSVLLHPDNSRERAVAISRWATDVTRDLTSADPELRGEGALLELATQGLAAAAKREDATDVRAWAQVVIDRARYLARRLSTEVP